MSRIQQEGVPWGATVDEDELYLRGQAGQVGSGLLGGWSAASYGGAFGERDEHDARLATKEAVRETVAKLVEESPPKLGPGDQGAR